MAPLALLHRQLLKTIGALADRYTKGWLPYTLRWESPVTEVREAGFSLRAWGDFAGRCVWIGGQDGSEVVIRYDWKVQAA